MAWTTGIWTGGVDRFSIKFFLSGRQFGGWNSPRPGAGPRVRGSEYLVRHCVGTFNPVKPMAVRNIFQLGPLWCNRRQLAFVSTIHQRNSSSVLCEKVQCTWHGGLPSLAYMASFTIRQNAAHSRAWTSKKISDKGMEWREHKMASNTQLFNPSGTAEQRSPLV